MEQMQSRGTDFDRLVDGLAEVTDAFVGAVSGVDPQATVPTCPEWKVRDLVGHIGQAYLWSAGLVRSRAAAPPPDPRDEEPGDPREWPTWLGDSAAELVAAVADTGPETTVWTFLGDRPARFWLRRMICDATVHVADAAAAGNRPFRISTQLATEAIGEGLELISAAGAADLKPDLGELRGDGQTLAFRPTDAGPGWLVTRTPGGVTSERRTAAADVTVTAPAADLLLLFSRRITPDDPRTTITGDRALLEHWWARTAF